MKWHHLVIMLLILNVSCRKDTSSSRSSTIASGGIVNASDPSVTSKSGIGSVRVGKNSFKEKYKVIISSIDTTKFAEKSELQQSAIFLSDFAMSVQIKNSEDETLFPLSPISFSIDLPSDEGLSEDYFVLLVGKDANGDDIINYVKKADVEITDNEQGGSAVLTPELLSGSFFAAVIKGKPENVLGTTVNELGSGGELVPNGAKEAPQSGAVSISFTDSDANGLQLTGQLTIAKATDESDVTQYVVYWGSDSSTKLSTTPIATISATGSNLTYQFAADTVIPTGATHLLVYTANAYGERATPISLLIIDLGVPTHAALSVAFTDGDLDGGEVSGNVSITKASSESDVTHYVLYWGKSASSKQSTTPIANVAVTGANLTYALPSGTMVPSSPAATHLLVFTKNSEGEMGSGVSVPINDKGLPVHAAANISFTDTDLDGGQVSGTVNITKASNESDVTDYVLYWGSDATTKQNATEIATIAANGANLSYNFAANVNIPTGPAATHLLVFTKNADGEMATGTSVAIVDLGVPTNAAASVAFTDTDVTGGELQGNVDITLATSETDLTHYVLYWGSNSTTKQSSTAIATIAKTGSNLQYTFSANTPIPTSPAATHLLVFTKNADGEMATGVSVAIVDAGVPTVAATGASFTDTDLDGGQMGGTLNITKASNEANITHYVIYWGSNNTTKQNATEIANVAVTGSNLTYNFGANTSIPTGPTATHLLIYTKNADGEMATGISVAISDKSIPTNAATSLSFTDTDNDSGQVAGTVTIVKASPETGVTHYVLYWGSNSTTKQNATPIAQIAVTGSNVTYNIAANTAIPSSPTATHLLVFTKNADGEMATGVSNSITDTGAGLSYLRLFVTAAAYPATTGVSGADTICQNDANAASLGGNFYALMSSTAVNAADRVTDLPVKLVDGTAIANNKAALFSGTILHGVDKTAAGGAVPGSTNVWTGSSTAGAATMGCQDWTTTSSGQWASMGTADTNVTGATWFTSPTTCNIDKRFYCIEY